MARKDSNGNPIGGTRRLRRNSAGTADWAVCDAETLRSACAAAAFVGGALRLGYSRDGGAYAVGIYGDGEPYTEFIKPSEDIDSFLKDVIEMFDDIKAPRGRS